MRGLRFDQGFEQILHRSAGLRTIRGGVREELQKRQIIPLDADEFLGKRQVQIGFEDPALQFEFDRAKPVAGFSRGVQSHFADGAGFDRQR